MVGLLTTMKPLTRGIGISQPRVPGSLAIGGATGIQTANPVQPTLPKKKGLLGTVGANGLNDPTLLNSNIKMSSLGQTATKKQVNNVTTVTNPNGDMPVAKPKAVNAATTQTASTSAAAASPATRVNAAGNPIVGNKSAAVDNIAASGGGTEPTKASIAAAAQAAATAAKNKNNQAAQNSNATSTGNSKGGATNPNITSPDTGVNSTPAGDNTLATEPHDTVQTNNQAQTQPDKQAQKAAQQAAKTAAQQAANTSAATTSSTSSSAAATPKATDSVMGNVTQDIASNSPLIQQAEAEAMNQANSRGLLNSSMATQAGQAAAYNVALPIASQDAQQVHETKLAKLSSKTQLKAAKLAAKAQKKIAKLQNKGETKRQKMQDITTLKGNKLNAKVQTKLKKLDVKTQKLIANMNVQADAKDKAMEAATSMAQVYAQMYDGIMSNPNIKSADRATYLQSIQNQENNDLGLVEQMYNINLDWGQYNPTGG